MLEECGLCGRTTFGKSAHNCTFPHVSWLVAYVKLLPQTRLLPLTDFRYLITEAFYATGYPMGRVSDNRLYWAEFIGHLAARTGFRNTFERVRPVLLLHFIRGVNIMSDKSCAFGWMRDYPDFRDYHPVTTN